MSWVQIQLDTTAPQIVWGIVGEPSPGSSFSAAYTIDEPGVVSAKIVDINGLEHSLDVGPDALTTASIPSGFELPAQIYALVRDDLNNEATRSYSIGAFPTEEFGGGARPFTWAPAVIDREELFEASFRAVERPQSVLSFGASFSAVKRHEDAHTASFTASVRGEDTFEGRRLPALRFARILREDEELLLSF